jgi:hypothetical protein
MGAGTSLAEVVSLRQFRYDPMLISNGSKRAHALEAALELVENHGNIDNRFRP